MDETPEGKVFVVKGDDDKAFRIKIDRVLMSTKAGRGQSLWWNREWEYRVNVTVSEPGVIERHEWPVDLYMNFMPPAHKYSIRVLEVQGGSFLETPYQISNVTMENTTHISSGLISFFVSLNKGESKIFQVYWSPTEKDPPSYTKKITVSTQTTPSGTKYIVMSSLGWSVEISPLNGGRASNITLADGDRIGHTFLHYGVVRNYTLEYGGYIGSGNTNNEDYSWRGFIEEQSSLESIFSGVVFVTHEVRNIPLRDEYVGDLGHVNYTYRFYPWGIIVTESVEWSAGDASDYLVGGWVFDQDDGTGSEATFNMVGRKGNITSLPETYKYATISGSLSSSWGNRFHTSGQPPWLRVHRIYLEEPNSYTIRVQATDQFFGLRDDPGVIVYSPGGEYVTSATGNNQVSVTVDTTPYGGGYYFIVIYCSDEDSMNSYMDYDIYLDTTFVAGDTVSASNGYGTIPPDAIATHDLYVDSAAGFNHTVSLSWSSGDDLDLYVFDKNGKIKRVSTGTSQGETTVFNATYIGHYSILVHRYSGTSASVAYTVETTVDVGPEYIDAYDFGPWENLTFMHSEEPRGVGVDFLNEQHSFDSVNIDMLWYNEGNDSDVDYIFFSRRYSGLTISLDDSLSITYALVIWEPVGDGDERYSVFNDTCISIENKPNVSIGIGERYLIRSRIHISDGNGYGIANVNITLYNSSGHKRYTSRTDSNGNITFDVERLWWNITSVLESGGYRYVRCMTVQYNDSSRYNYTRFEAHEFIAYSQIVYLSLRAYNNLTDPDVIQDGYVLLNSSVADNDMNMDMEISGYTNTIGLFSVYLPRGNWSIRFNKTGAWDNITIYLDQELANNITGKDSMHLISIPSRVEYYLKDWYYPEASITIVTTYLIVDTTPKPLDLYWKECFNLTVDLRRTDTDNSINGTIYWWIYNSEGVIIDSGLGTTNGSLFVLLYNTSLLDAGATYTIMVNSTVTESHQGNEVFQEPASIERSLIVKKRPTSAVVYFEPATAIYWNESLSIRVEYTDAMDTTAITQASVRANILGVEAYNLTEISRGIYELYIQNFYWDSGTYTAIIKASKDNYVGKEWTYTIVIYVRPTDLNSPTYVSIPWQDNYTLVVDYVDSRYDEPVYNASLVYELLDPNENVICNGTMLLDGDEYYAVLNISMLDEGTYTIYVYADKDNYESKEADVVLEVKVRATDLDEETTRLSIIYEETISVRFEYGDIDFDESIINASSSYTIVGVDVDYVSSGILLDLGNGTYLLNVSSIDIGMLGTFMIDIYITKRHYQSQSTTLTVVIDEIPTTASSSSTVVDVEWGENISLTFHYNRTDRDVGVCNATNMTYRIYHNETLVFSGLLLEMGDGHYVLILNTTLFVNDSYPWLGTYQLYVYLGKTYHENQTVVVSITVIEVDMEASGRPNDLEVIWGYTENVTITYNRTRDGVAIHNASYVVSSSPSVSGAFWVDEYDGYYLLVVNSTCLDVYVTYIVNVTLYKMFHEAVTVLVKMYVDPIPTIATASAYILEIEYGLNVSIYFWYNRTDMYPEVPIDADVSRYNITNSIGMVIMQGNMALDGSGSYIFDINTSQIVNANTTRSLGTYTIDVLFMKENYRMQVVSVTVTIVKVDASTYSASSNITMEWNTTYSASMYYNRTRDGMFIGGASWNISIYDEYGALVNVSSDAFVIVERGDFYELEINSTSLVTMLYVLEVEFYKEFHCMGRTRIFVNVEPVRTYAVPSQKSAEAEYPKNFTFKVWYYTEQYNISGANATYVIYYGEDAIEVGYLEYNATDESYELFLYTTRIFEESGATDLPVTLTAKLLFSKEYHSQQVLFVAYTISAISTKLIVSERTVTLRYGQNWTFYLNYTDTSGDIVLSDANATYIISINGTIVEEGILTYNSSVRAYTLFFSSEEIVNITGILGIYEVRVSFEKKFYEHQSMILSVRVDPMEANLEVSATSVEIRYLESYTFLFRYIDIAEGADISDANASYSIVYNGTVVLYGTINFNSSSGMYYLVFNSSVLINESSPNLGVYTIEVIFSKLFYEMERKFLSVNVLPRPSILEASETSVYVEYGEKHVFLLSYYDAEYGDQILGAEAQYSIYLGDTPVRGGVIQHNDTLGYFLIFDSLEIINDSWPYLGTYTVRIFFAKDLYVEREKIVSVTVTHIRTIAYALPETMEVEYGEVAVVKIYYMAKNGTGISGGDVEYRIMMGGEAIYEGEAVAGIDAGVYYIVINTTVMTGYFEPEWITYAIYINASRKYFEHQSILVSLTITKIACSVDLSDREVVAEWGERVSIELRVIENRTLDIVGDVNVFVEGLPNGSWNLDFDDGRIIIVVETSKLRLVEETNSSYLVNIRLYREFYSIPEQAITITVKKVEVGMRFVEEPPEYVEKIQFVGEYKVTEIEVLLTHNNEPVRSAEVYMSIYSVEAGVNMTMYSTMTSVPGVCVLSIDWSKFPPGYTWGISIYIRTVDVFGVATTQGRISYTPLKYRIRMDYMTGSQGIVIPIINKKIYLANMFYYPLLGLLALAIFYGGYRFISWYKLPWQVKEVDKIIKLIRRGVYEYRAPDRREYLSNMVRREVE